MQGSDKSKAATSPRRRQVHRVREGRGREEAENTEIYQYRPAKLVDRELYRAPWAPWAQKGPQRATGPKKYVLYFLEACGSPGTFGNIFGIIGLRPIFELFGPTYPRSPTHLL